MMLAKSHNLSEALTVTVQATITFSSLLLEDNYVLTFHEGSLYLANYLCTFYGRCTNFHVTVGVNEKNIAELYSVALFHLVAEEMNIQEFAGFGLELLSIDFSNCVHFKF